MRTARSDHPHPALPRSPVGRGFTRFPAAFLAALGLLFLAACQSPPEIDIERQWADTMRRLNMFGFYPMTEDVQIGDVFLYAPPRDGSPSIPRFSLVRLASFPRTDVMGEIRGQQERDRLKIQPLGGPTSDPAPAKPAAAAKPADAAAAAPASASSGRTPAPQLTVSESCTGFDIANADETRCPVRLQRSSIPALSVGRVSNAQLGAAGILGNTGARLGLGNNSQTAVSISLRNVQELTLDAWRIDRLRNDHETAVLREVWADLLMDQLRQMRPDAMPGLLIAVCNGDAARLANEQIEVMIINRVVYAGGIEYSFSRNAETALKFALDLQATLPSQPRTPVIPELPGGKAGAPPQPPAAVPAEPTAAAGQRLASLMDAVTGESGGAGRAGVTTSFGVGTFGSLALKEDFNRPIAVGAGSRVRYSFHDALAGHTGNQTLRERRFGDVQRYCERTIGAQFDRAALTRAMGMSAVPAGY